MEKFGFVMHPLFAKKDIARKYPFVRFVPEPAVEWALQFKGPMAISHITGVRSATGAEAEGWFVGCPLTAKQILGMPVEKVYAKIISAIRIAEDSGAKIIGLGAFTSVVGDQGITISKNVDIAVTTGNSYTIATAVQGALKGAELMGIEAQNAQVAVVGATGSIGKTCAQLLAKKCGAVTLIGRSMDRLEAIVGDVSKGAGASVTCSTDVASGIREADIVVAVSSAVDTIIKPDFIKSGAVVCDVARPRDVSEAVARERNDVLIIEGGVIAVPGDDLNFNFSFGFPPRTAYACMSETMILALEGRYEGFTLGKDISVEKVEEITRLADKHGFKLAGFRSFERAVTEEKIAEIRKNAGRS